MPLQFLRFAVTRVSRPLAVAATLAALLVLTGCQTRHVRLMSTPVAFSTSGLDPFSGTEAKLASTEVPVLYATNRQPLIDTSEPLFTSLPGPQVRVGIAHVRIGDHQLDWESLRQISLGEAIDQRPVVQLDWLQSKGALPADPAAMGSDPVAQRHAFFAMIDHALSLSPGREVVIYVHGVNSTVPRATAQAAQFQHFATRRVVVVSFLWPSAGSILRYFTDVGNARASIEPFARLLQALAEQTSARSINVLSYSAGAQIVSPALVRLAREGPDETQVRARLRIANVYYAAPDRDTRRFVDEMRAYIGIVGRVTAAMNQGDAALRVSQVFNRASRAGRPDKTELDDDQRQFMLDASRELDFDLLNVDPAAIPGLPRRSHAFWYEHPWVSSDVIALLLLDASPKQRGLVEQFGPKGARFWTFPQDFDQRIAQLFGQAKARDSAAPPRPAAPAQP